MTRISRHRGTEADQSHNYTIDVTRGELEDIAYVLGCYGDSEEVIMERGKGEIVNRLDKLREELNKYIENK